MSDQNTITSQAALHATVNGAIEILETAIADTPDDLANRPQPGSANPIGAIYAHALLSLDAFFTTGIEGGTLLLLAEGFTERIGLPDPNALGWPALQAVTWHVPALQAYAQAVYRAVHQSLASLDETGLGRPCTIFGQATTVADTLALATWHTALHAGEIAALKGVSDRPGLPF